MKAQDLKNSVLQLAIQGKLVEQNPNDEPASVLLERIKAEKEKLIKEKKIKKEKYNQEMLSSDELPQGWSYVKIGDISSIVTKQTGFDYSKNIKPNLETQKNDNNLPMIQTKNFKGYSFNFDTDYYLPKDIAIKFPKIILKEKCLLLSIVGASIGNIGVYDYDKSCILGGAICKVNLLEYKLYDYIYYFLQSDDGQKEIRKNYKSTAQGTITVQDVREIIIPIPPLEEQKRIVAKIEEVLEKIEEYDKAEKELTQLEKLFPQDMKKSILQYAIQGKLVEQNSNDEPASVLLERIKAEKEKLIKEKKIKKEKPLPEINEEEKFFDIPNTWEWVRLGNLGITQTGTTPSTSNNEYFGNYIPFIKPADITVNSINYFNEGLTELGLSKGRLIKANSIMMVCIGGSTGKCYFNDRDVACNQQINTITPIFIQNKYLLHVLQSDYFYKTLIDKATGTATPIVNKTTWSSICIPLPPLEEQKRIVEKVESIMNYIDKMQSTINNKDLLNRLVQAKTIEVEDKKILINN